MRQPRGARQAERGIEHQLRLRARDAVDGEAAGALEVLHELLELGGAVDGLLSQQADLDLESLEKAIGRTLSDREKAEIKGNTQRAYRWTFLVSGLEHPNFVKIVSELTSRGPAKLEAVARALSN